MSAPVRVAIVGLGLVSTSHLKGYLSHPSADVVGVCDLDQERAAAFAKRYDISNVYPSFDALLADPAVDAVDIATPTYLHASMTVEAAKSGKHVHCEKPFCRSVAEGRQAQAAAHRNNTILLVGETYVFIRSHVKARELIDSGEIGRPLQVRQRHGAWVERQHARVYTGPGARNWRIDPTKSGGGQYPWIFDHAVHFFATAEYFVPDTKIAEVYSVAAAASGAVRRSGAKHDPYETAEVDIPIISWKYEDPARQGVWMRAERLNGKYDYMRGFSTSIVGESGMIEVLGEGGANLLWEGKQQHLILHRKGKDTLYLRFEEGGDDIWESEISYYSKGHMAQIHHFVDCIVSQTPPRYSGADGVRAVRCTLAAIASAQQGRVMPIDEIDEQFVAYHNPG